MSLLDKLKKLPTLNELTGTVGEQLTKIMATIDIPDALVLQDVLIDGAKDQTTQIDLLLIGSKGIYVVEVKMYTGARVYGDCKKNTWYYYKGGQKYDLYSPYRQNQNHIKHLKEFLKDFGEVPCFSVLAILCEDYKISNLNDDPGHPTTIVINGLLSLRKAIMKLSEGKTIVFTDDEKQKIHDYIRDNQHIGKDARQVHKENVIAIKKAKDEEALNNICPYCKSPLVLRNGKNGEFWGCSGYPKCRYTKSK